MTSGNIVDTRFTHQLCALIPSQIITVMKDSGKKQATCANAALRQKLPEMDGVAIPTQEEYAVFCEFLAIFEQNAANLTITEETMTRFQSYTQLLTYIEHELSFLNEALNSRLCVRIKKELWAMLEDIPEKRRSAVLTQSLIEFLPSDYHLPLIYTKQYEILMGMLGVFSDQAENLILKKKDLRTFERFTKILNHYKELLN